jgi:L-ascorbate metabolism protein UlaG (beta-lactamase superfamily)
MKDRSLSLLMAAVLAAALLLPAPHQAAPALEVTYLANAGFLVQAGRTSFLIDALFREGVAGYARVPPATLEQMEAARSPYDRVAVVLATHDHADHFDTASVGRHLLANPEAVFVSGQEAVSQLEMGFPQFAQIGARVLGMMPVGGAPMTERIGNLAVTMLRLEHTPSHLGFLVTVEGRTLLHVGDATPTAANFAPYDLPAREIELAFVPYWYLLDDAGARVVREQIAARRLAVMHIPLENPGDERLREHLERHGGRAAMLDKLRAAFPGAVLFTEPLQTARF